MASKTDDDDLVMGLLERALACPKDERQTFLQTACGDDSGLLDQLWRYVRAQEQMNGFLLEPFHRPPAEEHPFQSGDLLDSRFRIVRKVAEGGMGVVYEALDEKLERRVALKCAKTG